MGRVYVRTQPAEPFPGRIIAYRNVSDNAVVSLEHLLDEQLRPAHQNELVLVAQIRC